MGQQNPTVMISLGGNAISPKNESGTIDEQFAHTRESLTAVMGFVKKGAITFVFLMVMDLK